MRNLLDIIIPHPQKFERKFGEFLLNKLIRIEASNNLQYLSELLKKELMQLGISLISTTSEHEPNQANYIHLEINDLIIPDEGYVLEINETNIEIKASKLVGIFYGIQTIKQLFLNAHEMKVPCGRVEDYPRFQWRGMMFDVGRHYHPIQTIKKMLDMMALLKMNRFHWHLTEDQGWRIEIKRYPKLTEIGSKRKDTQIGGFLSRKYRGIPHSGFYTQEEIRDIVQYAAERYIEIIPEIELPGHSTAAIASYPELGCTGKPQEVAIKSGIHSDIYCAGKEATFEFLENVLSEVIELFPSHFIHIGGDEAPKVRWKECSACQERIRKEGLKDEYELQVYFTNRIAAFLKAKGKTIIGWNEILGESLDPTAIAQWWAGKRKNMMYYLRKNRNFVMSYAPYVYLDYNYLLIPLRKTYRYEPIPKKLEDSHRKAVFGVETPIWTEWVPTEDRLHWQVFPRLIAVAEIGWTEKKNRNYKEFKDRLKKFLIHLDALKIKYAPINEVDPNLFCRIIKIYSWFRWPLI